MAWIADWNSAKIYIYIFSAIWYIIAYSVLILILSSPSSSLIPEDVTALANLIGTLAGPFFLITAAVLVGRGLFIAEPSVKSRMVLLLLFAR